MAITVNGIDELKALLGQTVGPCEWREVTQEMINTFAEISGDDQWIHVDVERAKTESPFGTTIAHGNLTLSLIDGFRKDLMQSTGFRLGVNYGWNKVRFPAPVPAGAACAPPPRSSSVDDVGDGWYQVATQLHRRGRGQREARVRGRVRRPRAGLAPTYRRCRQARRRRVYPRTSTERRRRPLMAHAGRCPDAPGVYLFKDSAGKVIYVGKATLDPQAGRRPLLEARRPRADGDDRRRSPTIDFVVTETEAEALLAEQNFIKRTGRSSTSACATTSRTPTSGSRWTRTSRASTSRASATARSRAYFGPFSNAKRVRETLDLLGKVFQHRTCDGPEPGRASRQPLPRLLHQALPGALRRVRLEGGVPREHRHHHRLPLRSLPPDRAGRWSRG